MNGVRALRLSQTALRRQTCRRSIAAQANPYESSPAGSSTKKSTANAPIIPLGNIEMHWETLADKDKYELQEQLDEVQKKDWKALSHDEKKAAYFIAFGPHGPRAPVSKPGDNLKIFLSVTGLCGIAVGLHLFIRSIAPPPPKTMTKEWQEASTKRAKDMNLNPITGISSEGYTGKGFIQSK